MFDTIYLVLLLVYIFLRNLNIHFNSQLKRYVSAIYKKLECDDRDFLETI